VGHLHRRRVVDGVCLFTIVSATRSAGQPWHGVFAVLPLIGALGLFLKRPWARFAIYAFSVAVVPTWVVYTIWFISKAGWPYYATTLQSVLGLVPGVLLCAGCGIACWAVHRYFRAVEPSTVATRG
jgi:hypothetical protein